jgi:hypothetical protein
MNMKKLLILTILILVTASCTPTSYINHPAQSGTNPLTTGNNPAEATPTVQPATSNPQPAAATPQPGTPAPSSGLPNFDHIVLIMLENRDYQAAIDGKQMPLLAALARQNVLLTNYYAVTHPSLPNYIALMSGSTQGITTDCNGCFVNQPNLADRIEASGRTWKAYLEGLPSACFVGNSGNYAQKHDPLIYFDSIRQDATRCDRSILPLTSLESDLANNQLPNFAYIMPDLCNSGHSCSAGVADKWVNDMVQKLQASPALGKNSLIMIAFDEASDSDTTGCCGISSPAGGHVAAVLISPSAIPGYQDATPYSHYSLLKTILAAWNLPALGQTTQAAILPITAPWTGQPGQAANPDPATQTATQAPTITPGPTVTHAPAIKQPTMIQAGSCATSSPASGAYSVEVCFSSPAINSTVSGDVSVAAVVKTTGSTPVGVQRLVFYLDGTYLLTSYARPFLFTLQTTNYVDGTHILSVEAQMRDKFTSQQGSLQVTFHNGVTTPPVNTNAFQPTSGRPAAPGAPFIVAAGGDGAGGESNATNVVNLIASLNPNLLLYLGDVYQNGSPAEFYNWYGTSSTFFGQFRSITDPTIGNHEYLTPGASGYFNYWDNIPNYYSFNAGGWHFISLNSNSPQIAVGLGSPQYVWLQNDLASNAQTCTIVYYHEPLYNIGTEPAETDMAGIWSLLAQYGVSIVLNGHDHDYQRWVPLDGNGKPDPNGVTEFVVGSSGHGIQKFTKTDNRVAYANDTQPAAFGILELQLSATAASFSYLSTSGTSLDSGTIPCGHASPASQAPAVATPGSN